MARHHSARRPHCRERTAKIVFWYVKDPLRRLASRRSHTFAYPKNLLGGWGVDRPDLPGPWPRPLSRARRPQLLLCFAARGLPSGIDLTDDGENGLPPAFKWPSSANSADISRSDR